MRQDGHEDHAIRPLHVYSGINDKLPAALLVTTGDTKIYVAITTTTEGSQLVIKGTDLSDAPHHLTQITDWLTTTLHDQFDKVSQKALMINYVILASDGAVMASCYNAIVLALAQMSNCIDIKNFPVAMTVGNTLTGKVKVDLEARDLATLDTSLTMIAKGDQINSIYQNVVGANVTTLTSLLTTGLVAAKARQQQMQQYLQKTLMPYQNLHLAANTIVIATHNLNKTREYRAIFTQAGLQVKTLADFPDLPSVRETGQTFEENARLKADQIANLLNLPVLADDSGLMVDALHGRPGIFSARFAKDHDDAANNQKLLTLLADVPDDQRTATFHTTIVLAKPHQPYNDLVVEGELHGRILRQPRGNDGFGYDPLFYVPRLHKTLAQLTPEQKNAISHRGNAVRALAQRWPHWWQA
ncbi:MAG: XTP/dITP diphosphatase [Candidatus Paralactobacillus gallistercoris]|uniref:dITP/XTP pyrophosphatase n=1 Tax=Candidatus Paralactobacillus gallistercoris TaxID=2838724 RepID=A0A948WZ92_9LACO|nr:XTP/dITP diphosphatase [Candidatus Paralactobacillus gallistercoris]